MKVVFGFGDGGVKSFCRVGVAKFQEPGVGVGVDTFSEGVRVNIEFENLLDSAARGFLHPSLK